MIKFLFLAICYLFIYPCECKAGRISYSLNRLDAETDDIETPYNRRSTCGLIGTRLLIKYEVTNPDNQQYESLWSAEVKYIPENVRIRQSAPKINSEPSAVFINYFLYGATLENSKQTYRNYYNLGVIYDFPLRENGNFQYQTFLATPGFARLSSNTELFRWERMDDNRHFSMQTIIDTIATLRNGNNFPPYCAKGFTFGLGSRDVLNCITFDMRILHRFGIPVNNNNFINQYLESTSTKKKIAYPERFLEPLVRICTDYGGWINLYNISDYYNNAYYTNKILKELLEPQQQADEVINQAFPDGGAPLIKKRYGQMWIIGEPSIDRRPSVNNSTLAALGFGGAGAGYLGATAAAGGTGTLVATASAINGGVAFLATSTGFLATGAALPTVVTIGAPVLVLGAVGMGVGYIGVYSTKKVISWF